MKTGFKVGDAMTFDPIFASPETSVQECAQIMKKKGIGSLIVLDGVQLLGILTEYDIVRKVVAKALDVTKIKAKDIMVKKIITVTPDIDIYDALVKMRDNDIRHLPVAVNRDLKGFLTLKDILKIEPELFDILVDTIILREETEKPIDSNFETGVCDGCQEMSSALEEEDGLMLCRSCRRASK